MRTAPDRPILQALTLAAAAGLLGLVVNAASPGGIDLARPVLAASGASAAATCEVPVGTSTEIGIADGRALHAAGAAFVDARPAGEYAAGHIPGAYHLPSIGECPDGAAVILALRGATTVVVYDDEASCALARRLADRLLADGVADVRVMLGGFSAWRGAGEPAEAGECAACDAVAGGTR